MDVTKHEWAWCLSGGSSFLPLPVILARPADQGHCPASSQAAWVTRPPAPQSVGHIHALSTAHCNVPIYIVHVLQY